jgi:magnesium chelatase subunit D
MSETPSVGGNPSVTGHRSVGENPSVTGHRSVGENPSVTEDLSEAVSPSPPGRGGPSAAVYPFSAVVGQEEVKLALLLATVDPALSGVLLRGERGAAKTTLARGLARLLPDGAPFVELPLGATEDRVAGSIDLGRALAGEGVVARRGLLADADGGVLYVDEVNLLPDHLVDLLLDVAASGRNRVERDGVAFEHRARFVLIGSMNPEEGELRPQLLDRFGLSVEVVGTRDPVERARAVERRLAFDADPAGFVETWAAEEGELAGRLAAARTRGAGGSAGEEAGEAAPRGRGLAAPLAPGLMDAASRLALALDCDGLRADLALCRAAAALAAWEGTPLATTAELARVAPAVLGHRARKAPLEAGGLDPATLEAALESALDGPRTTGPHRTTGSQREASVGRGAGRAGEGPAGRDGRHAVDGSGDEDGRAAGESAGEEGSAASRVAGEDGTPGGEAAAEGGSDVPDGDPTAPPRPSRRGAGEGARRRGSAGVAPAGGLDPVSAPGGSGALSAALRRVQPSRGVPSRPGTPSGHGRGGRSPGQPDGGSARGRVIGDRPYVEGDPAGVSAVATLRASVGRHAREEAGPPGRPALEDLRSFRRLERAGNLVVLVVDASGSMGAARRLDVARAAAYELLTDAYQRRDRVAVVALRAGGADVLLRPTASVEVARARLAGVTTGGRTALAAGLDRAHELATSTSGLVPVVVVVSDGRATAGPAGEDPVAAALAAARRLRLAGIRGVVVDAEDGRTRLGLAGELAEALGASLVRLEAGQLTAAVRDLASPA